MLLALKEDNTTGNFYLCGILHVLSVIIKYGVIFTSMHLYTIMCTVGVAVYMYLCMLLVICVVWILQNY